MRRLDDFTQQKNRQIGIYILIDIGLFDSIYLSKVSNQFSDETVYQYTGSALVAILSYSFFNLILKVPRKNASENVVC